MTVGPSPLGALDPTTILLVEDEEIVRRVTELMLTQLGYRVFSAANAEEALEVLEAQGDEVSLLLTDVVMPGLNGGELATVVRRERPELKVLYMSGFVPHELDQRVRAFEPFLAKPFSPDQISRAVRDVLND